MDSLANEALRLIYQRKYLSLKRRCEEVQQANEKLVNRIYNVKKILRRYKKERSVLMERLDHCEDDYQNALVPAFWQEGAGEDDGEAAAAADHQAEQETSLAVAAIADVKQEPGVANSDSMAPAPTEPKKVKKSGKKPANAYLLFCTMQRKTVQAKYLEMHGEEPSYTELSKQLAVEWRQLSPEEKIIYHNIAELKKRQNTAAASQSTTSGDSSYDVTTAESESTKIMAGAASSTPPDGSSNVDCNTISTPTPPGDQIAASSVAVAAMSVDGNVMSADGNVMYHVVASHDATSLQADPAAHAQFGVAMDTTSDLDFKTEVKVEEDTKDFI